MTHGDAIIILRNPTNTKETKLEALGFIFEHELKTDYNCLTKPQLWELVRFLYKEVKEKK